MSRPLLSASCVANAVLSVCKILCRVPDPARKEIPLFLYKRPAANPSACALNKILIHT